MCYVPERKAEVVVPMMNRGLLRSGMLGGKWDGQCVDTPSCDGNCWLLLPSLLVLLA